MRKKSVFDIAVLATMFAIFLTSSFDLVGSVKFMGFTIRAVYLFVLLGAGFTLYRWIKLKKLILPEGFLLLGIWMILIFAFIPNSPLVIRNIGYGGWLLLNVAMIFFVVNFMSRDTIDVFVRMYLLSFFAVSLLGIVQYITPQIGLPPFVVEQWWVPDVLPRVNAFTYEPSFFATYLLFGIPAMLILPARGNFAGIPKWLYYIMLVVDVTALILCSSRLGILLFLFFLAGFMIHGALQWIRERKLGFHLAMSCAVPLMVTASVLLLMNMRLQQVNKDDAAYTYLRGTGWNEKDITKAQSLTIRLQTMKKTFDVFRQNPVIGVSLGGIAPWIAATSVSNITSNDQVKPFEGVNVPLEILAASGVIGFVVFCIYVFLLCRPLLKKWSGGRAKDYYFALFWGFVMGFLMLVENQNILRTYVWAHIALMSGVIRVLSRHAKERKDGRGRSFPGLLADGLMKIQKLVPDLPIRTRLAMKNVFGGRSPILAGNPGRFWTVRHKPVPRNSNHQRGSMRLLAIVLAAFCCMSPLLGQTVLINKNEEGGFQNGATFADNGWTVVNGSPNSWYLAQEVANLTHTSRLAFISFTPGGGHQYDKGNPSVSHFYRDVDFPAGETMILLEFELAVKGYYTADDLKVFLVSTDVTPVAGVELGTGVIGFASGYANTPNADLHGVGPLVQQKIIVPPSAAGTTMRLVFSWRNSDFRGDDPPAIIDNIDLVSQGSVTSNGTGGGPWESGTTWIGGSAPVSTDNVTIQSGDLVNINSDFAVKNLVVEGTVEFESGTPRTIEITNEVIVDQGGTLRSPASGSAMHTIILGEDLFNNGTTDLSTNGGAAGINLEFTGSGGQTLTGSGVLDLSSIIVNTATSTATVLMNPSTITVKGAATDAPGFLIPQRGTVRLSGDSPLESVVFTTTFPGIATSTAVWFDNPNLVVNPQAGGMNVVGTLRVSAGVVNVGEDDDDCIILSPGGTFIMEGGAVNVSAAIGVTSPSNAVKFQMSGGEIKVQRFGNSSTTFAGFDLGTSSLTTATSTAGTIIVEQSNTALTGPGDFRVPLGFNITGGELHLGNATTTAQTTFRIRGAIPNLVVDPTRNHTVQLFQTSTFVFPTTLPSGITLDLNGNTLSLRGDLDIPAGATLTGNATGSTLSFGGSSPQVFNMDGTLTDGYVRSLVIINFSGATPAVSINDDLAVSNTVFLTNGSLGGSGTLTLGNITGSSIFTLTRVNGSMLTTPLFDSGVTFNASYNNSIVQTVTGPELPSIVTGTLTINDPAGVYLNATTTATTLSLTNGSLNTADSRVMIVAGTSPSNIVSSGAGFVSGPVIITLPTDLTGLVDYPVPVGTTVKRPVTLVAPKTDATPNTRIFIQAYDYFGGVPGDGISALPDGLRWFVTALTGQGGGTVTETRVAFSEGGYGGGSEIAKSETIDGTYNSIGGSVLGTTITSDVFSSFSYFAVGLTDNTKSGVYTVGSGGDYATITAAIADLDTSALSGPVVLSLTDPSYTTSETFPIVIKQMAGINAVNTLTIKPATGISPLISGSNFDFVGLIKLEGADYVTIDGSNDDTDSRDMTITCTDTYNPVIWLSSQGAGLGARKNTIKNLNLSGGLSQVSTNTGPHAIIGSGSTPISDGADNDSNMVYNNLITKVRYGVVFRGVSGNPNEGNSVTDNYIGAATFGPDQIGKVGIGAMHQSGITISGNTIRSLGSIHPNIPDGAGDDRVGIALGADSWPPISTSAISNAVVTGNVIQDIIEESTQSSVGILIAASGSSTNNLIANNMISGVRANGTSGNYAAGIGFHSGQGDKIVFNSIRMEGDIDPGSSTTATGSNIGINVRGGSNLTVKNNIVYADLTSNTGTLEHYAITAPSSYNWGTGGIDYNDYHINTSNAQMKLGGIGSAVPYTPYADLAVWKTNFSAQQDANSKSFDPDFTSAADLHLNVASADVNYAGTPVSGVTTDIDGDTRGEGSPYIGADEVTEYPIIVAPAAPLLAYPADNATNVSTTVELEWNPSPGASEYQLQVATDVDFVSTVIDESALVDTSFAVSPLNNSTEYFWRVAASNTAGAGSYSSVFSFTTEAAAPTPPASPAGLVVTDSSSRTLTIKWNQNAEPDFLRYRIYRGTAPNPTTQVDSTTGGIGDTSKTLTSLTNGTRYYLRVTAVDSAGSESGYSNEVNAVPADRIKPAAPQDLVVTDSSAAQIRVAWTKNTDADFLKYLIYRGTAPAPTTLVDSSTASIADTGKLFTGLVNGTRYYFRVTALDSSRNESVYSNEVDAAPNVATGMTDLLSQIPEQFSLSQNYPNPFNPSTVIRYGLPERSLVKMELFDVLGRRIAILVDQEQEARYYEVLWKADVPSGIYFYRISAVAVANRERIFQEIRRMVLLR